ncbi:MAG: hypothetical protein QGG54_11985, partial [Gammaproteobacteria bacterium]|nr:hypothetical protein [Gammaproteobacteria bacterium]
MPYSPIIQVHWQQNGIVTEAPVSESYSVEAVEQAGGMFSNKFTALIDEMVAFQKDPDYQRAESRR